MGLDHLSCFNGTNCPFIYREDAPSEPLKLIGADHYQSAAGCIEPFTSCFRFTSRIALKVAIGTDPCGPLRAPPPACQGGTERSGEAWQCVQLWFAGWIVGLYGTGGGTQARTNKGCGWLWPVAKWLVRALP